MDRRVHVIQRSEVFKRAVFRIDEVHLQYERFDGSMSEPMSRLIFERGDSVAVLPSDAGNRMVLLCEQFRAPTYEHGPGWLLEVPAGIVEAGETEERCAQREVFEETGYDVRSLQRIATVYLSPGGSSERVHIFHAAIKMPDNALQTAGVVSEGEDIRLVRLPFDQAIAKARGGEILDAKTLIALQWLERESA
jgi:ADP-ribose pyrophosphatase